jgi:hypothetical protein
LEVLDLVARGGAPDHGVMSTDAGIGQPEGVVEFSPDLHLVIDQFEFPNASTLLNEQFSHGVLSGLGDLECSVGVSEGQFNSKS